MDWQMDDPLGVSLNVPNLLYNRAGLNFQAGGLIFPGAVVLIGSS